jgi:hypothetical protein
MNASRRPFFVITTLVFGGLALFFWGLYQREVEKDLMPSGNEIIGEIVRSDLDVARRLNSRLLWAKLEDKATVYKKDTIRTGPKSSVVVRLNNKSSIALGENTLVVLETENESLSLKLADGDVEFSGDITVSLDGNTKLRAVDGTLRLRRDSSTGQDRVAAVSGQAQVVSDGRVSIVESGEVLVKGQEGAFRMSGESLEAAGLGDLGLKDIEALENMDSATMLKLNSLEPKTKLVKSTGSNVVRLSWNAPKEASKYLVKVGSQEFSVLEPKFDISVEDLAPLIDEKVSVRAIGSCSEGLDQSVGLDSSLKETVVVLGSTPKNRTPFQGSRILSQKKTVNLNWSEAGLKHKDFMHYNIIVKTPQNRTREFKSKVAALEYEFSGSGVYSWHVQPVFRKHGPGLVSSPTTFEVVGGANLAAPTISPASEDN